MKCVVAVASMTGSRHSLPSPLAGIDGRNTITDRLESDRLRTLIDIGGFIVADLDLDSVLARVLEAACRVTGARYAALGVLNDERTELERFITRGLDADAESAIGERPRGRGVLGALIRDPAPLRLRSLDAHPMSYGFPAAHPSMGTFLGVPVLIRGQAWGNLYLTEKRGGEFDQADEDAAVMLARWTAIAIENARLYRDAERRRRELERAVRGLEATQAIAHAIGADTDLDRVLELIVKRGRALVQARSVVILLRDGDELVLTASAGHSRRLHGERIPIDGSTSGAVMQRGLPERVTDVQARLRIAPEQLGVDDARSALLVPLAYRGEPLGVLIAFDHDDDDGATFSDDEEEALRAFGASAATAVATARGVQRRRLADALAAAEAERRRWAQELHDETLQALGGLRILLSAARRSSDPAVLATATDRAIEQIEQEITNLGSIITELRPAALDALGLAAALDALFDRHRSINDLEIDADLLLPGDPAGPRLLDAQLEATTYRLVQEALTNVVKHARASRVHVGVRIDGSRLVVEIADDGGGFAVDKVGGGFGLTGMRERALMAGGDLRIESSSTGTTVWAALPLPPDAPAAAIAAPAQRAGY